jgi:hypothetical protein
VYSGKEKKLDIILELMSGVGLEHTISVFKSWKTLHAIDHMSTVVGIVFFSHFPHFKKIGEGL